MLSLFLTSSSLATAETWTREGNMPTATSLHSAGVVDGKIYIIGGTDNIYQWANYWSTVFMYDPLTDTWTRKADLPAGRARLCAGVVDGKIYAIGGSPHRDSEVPTVEMYDPATDTWTRKTDMPRARNFLSSSVVNGKIYVIGGKIYPSETMVSTVEVYDPATDTWTRKADMPTARGMHSASVVNGKIYVIGGVTGAYGPWISTVEMYDPATDSWTRKTNMPTARSSHSSSALNGKIYVIGGGYTWDFCSPTVEVYDPAADSWTRGLNMPTARCCHSASVVNGKIYTIGGILDASSWTTVATVEVYDLGLIGPPPDFNGDGLVDIKDLLRLIESWGQDDPAIDFTPPPFGDGRIDASDLEVLMSFWEQPIDDPTLFSHWALDETEGMLVTDSAGMNDGYAIGNPIWRPDGGQVNGALEFDGIDDYVIAGFAPNPEKGPFSVFVWIKGGAPGQVVISQLNEVNWLGIDSTLGCLMTELCESVRNGIPLISDAMIADGVWHRIGFVWDGTYRTLYVDDVLVAQDVQQELDGAVSGLNMGCGSNAAAGTFFSGLIDEVRIYSRAVSP
jgi:N-acetylneuraminic acid mutarotase